MQYRHAVDQLNYAAIDKPDMEEQAPKFDDLLHLVQCGNEDALLMLVEHYQEDIRIIARAHLGPALRPYMDSLDLVQSVHHSLIVGLRANKYEFTSPDKLVALAGVVLRRKVARHWRKMRKTATRKWNSTFEF